MVDDTDPQVDNNTSAEVTPNDIIDETGESITNVVGRLTNKVVDDSVVDEDDPSPEEIADDSVSDYVNNDVVVEGTLKEPPITNVNHMLATLLAENIVVLSTVSGLEPLVVPHTGLYRDGVFGYTEVKINYKGTDLELLYHLTREHRDSGSAVWCLIQNADEPSQATLDHLAVDGWLIENIRGADFDELGKERDKAGYFRTPIFHPLKN